jgi:hypothetical protein
MTISDFLVNVEESNKLGWYLLNLGKMSLKIKWTIINRCRAAFTLDDYVVHDHTNVNHLSHLRLPPGGSRVPNNGKMMLEHTKGPLDIFATCFLYFAK